MKKAWKFLKRVLLGVVALLILIVLGAAIFVSTAPQFGQPPSGADLERIQQSPNYGDGRFINPIETTLGSFSDMVGTLPDLMAAENLQPADSLPVAYDRFSAQPDSLAYVTWFGHSAFLIEMDGRRILIDPMFGDTPSPLPFGTPRFPNKQPIPLDDITDIDYVILSHDHYDHLDYFSILLLKDRVRHFLMPLGVGSHLRAWGVPAEQITELDWWEKVTLGGIEMAAVPARHFSGRGVTDRNSTQWAGWVINGNALRLFFSGDGGYGPHFQEIGERYGPFDLALLECGQYNQAWKDIHLLPEESVQAGIDVRADVLMPIHWGAFALAVHPWKEPIERFKTEADRRNVPLVHPLIGERFSPGTDFPREPWWAGIH